MKVCQNQVKTQYNSTNPYATILKIYTNLEQGHKNIKNKYALFGCITRVMRVYRYEQLNTITTQYRYYTD